MRALRQLLAALVCASYLPAATLPCPTPGLERVHSPSTTPGAQAEAGAAADPHAGHAHTAATRAPAARGPEAAGASHADHAGHASQHGPSHAAEPPAASAAAEPGAHVAAPCPCGCGKHGSSSPANARLGPVLISQAATRLEAQPAPRTPAPERRFALEPFRGLDPVPI